MIMNWKRGCNWQINTHLNIWFENNVLHHGSSTILSKTETDRQIDPVSSPLDGIWVRRAVYVNGTVLCDAVMCGFFNYSRTTSGLATPAVWRSCAVPHNNRSTSITLFLWWWDAKIVLEIWITAQLYPAPGRRRFHPVTFITSRPLC